MTATNTTLAATTVRAMSALATLNTLRAAAGKAPLKAWKESRAKLDAAIEKAHAEAPITRATPDVSAKAVIAKIDEVKKVEIVKANCSHGFPTFLCVKCTPKRRDDTAAPRVPRPTETVVKSVAIKPTLTAEQQKIRDADRAQFKKKPKAGARARYDWEDAEAKAAKGVLATPPDMSAPTHRHYVGKLGEIATLARTGKLKELQAYKVSDRDDGSPGLVKRYQKLAIVALKAKA